MRTHFLVKTTIAALASTMLVSAAWSEDFPVYLDGETRTQSVTPPEDQSAPVAGQSVFYQIAYPKNFASLGMSNPICNPCNHGGDGVQWTDYHDHLMTRPDLPLRHVFNIGPAYTGDADLDARIVKAYADRLPVISAVAANQLLALRLPTGEPVAEIADLGFYFNAVLID